MFEYNIRSLYFIEQVLAGQTIKPHYVLIDGEWHCIELSGVINGEVVFNDDSAQVH